MMGSLSPEKHRAVDDIAVLLDRHDSLHGRCPFVHVTPDGTHQVGYLTSPPNFSGSTFFLVVGQGENWITAVLDARVRRCEPYPFKIQSVSVHVTEPKQEAA